MLHALHTDRYISYILQGTRYLQLLQKHIGKVHYMQKLFTEHTLHTIHASHRLRTMCTLHALTKNMQNIALHDMIKLLLHHKHYIREVNNFHHITLHVIYSAQHTVRYMFTVFCTARH